MPYFSSLRDDDDEELRLQLSAPQSTTSPQVVGGSKGLNTGSGYHNLEKYLQGGQGFQSEFLGKIGKDFDQAEQGIKGAAGQFKDQVTQLNKTPTTQQITNAIANPNSVDPSTFQSWQKQTYQGPKDLSENKSAWDQYWGGVNRTEGIAKNLGSESGRSTLLEQYFGRPNYTYGQKALDNLLLGNAGSQASPLQERASQIKAQATQQNKGLQNYVSEQQGKVQQSRNAVNNAYNTAVGNVKNAVEDKLTNLNKIREAEKNKLLTNLEHNYLNRDQIGKFGLSPLDQLFGINLTDQRYLTTYDPLKLEQVATPEQKIRLDALNQLAGTPQTYLGTLSSPTETYSVDKDTLRADLNQRKTNYEDTLRNHSINGGEIFRPEDVNSRITTLGELGDLINQYKGWGGTPPAVIAKMQNLYDREKAKIDSQFHPEDILRLQL